METQVGAAVAAAAYWCRLLIGVCVVLQALGPALLPCVDPADRISFMEPSFPQHYPAFQSPEPYFSPHSTLGDVPAGIQKPSNPRLYMGRPGYEFQGYLSSPSYPMTSDLCDPRLATDQDSASTFC